MAERTNLSMGIGQAICQALGIDAGIIGKMTLTMDPSKVLAIDLHIVPDDRIHNVVIPGLRNDGVVVNITEVEESPNGDQSG